ncbi:MAG: DUF456 domain-containing protein [Anaerolineae bacterium]
MDQILNDPLLLVTLIVMAISLFLTLILPILPGQFLVWLAAVGYGLAAGWEKLGWPTFFVLTGAVILAAIVDAVLGILGARLGGASAWGIVAGLLLGLVGLIVFNAFGAVVGAVAGLMAVEWYRHQEFERAWKASLGYLAGLVASVVVRFVIALLMVIIFLWRVL